MPASLYGAGVSVFLVAAFMWAVDTDEAQIPYSRNDNTLLI